ncbi:hypothetical protein FH972_018456 [Carpinus fangiana]|uniref:Uncharacterized protein n=1 Tax=Carpinus fangiana TaxID=176857 RepID=A0A5N6RR08_9ROSI|nr:hypothetical protein FH972_018456 [Carpinus fangiana]
MPKSCKRAIAHQILSKKRNNKRIMFIEQHIVKPLSNHEIRIDASPNTKKNLDEIDHKHLQRNPCMKKKTFPEAFTTISEVLIRNQENPPSKQLTKYWKKLKNCSYKFQQQCIKT